MGRVTALSRAFTTVTWMSHGSHEPDVDESRLEQAGPWYQCLSSKQTGSACGVPLVACNQMWVQNSVAELWNEPLVHLATDQAKAVGKVRRGGL